MIVLRNPWSCPLPQSRARRYGSAKHLTTNSVLTLSRRGTAQAGLRLRCAFCHLNHFMPEFASGGGENETTMAHRRGPACGVPSRFGGGRKSFPLATSANSVGVHAAPCA